MRCTPTESQADAIRNSVLGAPGSPHMYPDLLLALKGLARELIRFLPLRIFTPYHPRSTLRSSRRSAARRHPGEFVVAVPNWVRR